MVTAPGTLLLIVGPGPLTLREGDKRQASDGLAQVLITGKAEADHATAENSIQHVAPSHSTAK